MRSHAMDTYDPPLDDGIRVAVEVLRAGNVETFESCEGGPHHAYPEPTVRFFGDQPEGFRALSVAMRAGLAVKGLRRGWPLLHLFPTRPPCGVVLPPPHMPPRGRPHHHTRPAGL